MGESRHVAGALFNVSSVEDMLVYAVLLGLFVKAGHVARLELQLLLSASLSCLYTCCQLKGQ